MFRNSRPEVFFTKGIHKNFAKVTGKHLCRSLFLIKLQASGLHYAFNTRYFWQVPKGDNKRLFLQKMVEDWKLSNSKNLL